MSEKAEVAEAMGWIACLFGLVFVVLFIAIDALKNWPKHANQEPSKPEQTQNRSYCTPPSATSCESPSHANNASQERHNWWERRYWTIYLIFTCVGTFGALLAAVFAVKAFEQARRQANAAVDGNRPWLGIVKPRISGIPRHDPIGLELSLALDIKNYGKDPALGVFTDVKITPLKLERGLAKRGDYMDWTPRNSCKRAVAGHQNGGRVIFPNEEMPVLKTLDVPQSEINDAGTLFVITVSGCMAYSAPYDTTPHWSSFVYLLAYPKATEGISDYVVPEMDGDPVRPPANGSPITPPPLIGLDTLLAHPNDIGFTIIPDGWTAE